MAIEPTVFALLALSSADYGDVVAEGIQNLRDLQLADGQWPMIRGGAEGSPWATALCATALMCLSSPDEALERALVGLVRSEPQEAFWLWRLKFRMQDKHVRFNPSKFGWSWVPGTISWVIPTSLSLIVLERARKQRLIGGSHLDRRLRLGYDMLLDRVCPSGGWNAGNSIVYGVPLAPHVDATAISLIALKQHCDLPEVRQSLSWLLSADCVSACSLAWKILGLESCRRAGVEISAAIEATRARLTDVSRCPEQLADTVTLALTILALAGGLCE